MPLLLVGKQATICLSKSKLLAIVPVKYVRYIGLIYASSIITNFWYRIFCHPLNTEIIPENEITNEPPHDKTNEMACAPSEDSDQPGHLPV